MQQIAILILIIIGLYILGVMIPKAINDNFAANYGGEVWSNGIAIAEGTCLAAFLLFMEEDGMMFWIPLILTVLSYALGIWSSYEKAKLYGAGKGQICLGVLAQILASGALAFVILFVIAMVLGANNKKRGKS